MTKTAKITVAGIAIVAVVFAILAWQRRWMCDDGMIVVRTVRQILEGNGPNFNEFERAEANTSTLWTYVLVVFAGVTRLRIEYLAVYLGMLLSVGAVLVGMDATRRMLRARGSNAIIVPGAVMIVIGVFPFWDYATSGLETGLCFAWVTSCWWLLVHGKRHKLAAFVFGLGPLVRPDLAIGSIAFFSVMWLLHRPNWRTTLAWAGIGIALPFAYEIFRMGYYGTLVPLPALAKSATESVWSRGWIYLEDFAHPAYAWFPILVVGALFAYVLWARKLSRRELLLIAAPIATALVNALYVLRVGGDYMHARMFLVPVFTLLLPAFVLPLRRFTAPVAGALALWAIVMAIRTGDGESHVSGPPPIEDERVGYVAYTGKRNPIHERVFIRADLPAAPLAADAMKKGERLLVSQFDGFSTPMNPAHAGPLVYVAGRLGTAGAVAPLDGIVADTLGLANPLGARITPTLPGYTGHEKALPWAWTLADFGDPARDKENLQGQADYLVRAARRAMKCGELDELMKSVREPMSPSRFWANLTGAVRRTRLVIPNDPIEAVQKFCGNSEIPMIRVSSVFPFDGWSKYGVVDGVLKSYSLALGHTSKPKLAQGPEWIELRYPEKRTIGKVALYTAAGGPGFPEDFEIQIWNGSTWVTRVTQKAFTPPGEGPHDFTWQPLDQTDRIRVIGTKLRVLNGEYVFQLGEIQVSP